VLFTQNRHTGSSRYPELLEIATNSDTGLRDAVVEHFLSNIEAE
jgi:hypothetical protein